jgi:hypothetical protein
MEEVDTKRKSQEKGKLPKMTVVERDDSGGGGLEASNLLRHPGGARSYTASLLADRDTRTRRCSLGFG